MNRSPASEPCWMKWILILASISVIVILILLPLISIFVQAFSRGAEEYFRAFQRPDSLHAIKLTLYVASLVVPLNIIFGLSCSWAIGKFPFRGKHLLMTCIDLPLSVSPVIAGMIFVLLFNPRYSLGHWLIEHDIRILYATPGIVIATLFVTFPFVARELIPLMEEQGAEEEEAALLLGASGWKTFFRVTLSNVKWGLLYGALICNARAMGEFGAVSVVSGHIQGETNTLSLQVEALYNEYRYADSFAIASLLSVLAILTLVLKNWIERKSGPVEKRKKF